MFNPEEISDLKRLAIAGILSGSTLAAIPYIRPGKLLSSKSQTIGSPVVEVPVPGQEQLPNTSEFFQKIRKSKSKGKGKRLQSFKPGEGVAIKGTTDSSEKKGFDLSSLANPYYLPAAGLAVSVPMVGSHYLLSKLYRNKVKKDRARELEDAKREFGEALVEAHSNRLTQPVEISRPLLGKTASAESSLSEDLEKLASLCLYKKANGPEEYKPSPLHRGLSSVGEITKNLGNIATKGVDLLSTGVDLGSRGLGKLDKILENGPNIFYGGLGLAGLLALTGGALGTWKGYSSASKADEEKLQSERYLNEFLSRRSAEGMPIHSVPVPVRVNKNNTLKPVGNITERLNSEA